MTNVFEIRKSDKIAEPTEHPRFATREEAEAYLEGKDSDGLEICQVMGISGIL